ncbi:MAG: transglutaminase domain-containing protein [Halobacteriota archaeon]
MVHFNETVKGGSRSNGLRLPPMASAAFAFAKFILVHPSAFMKNRKMRPDEERYIHIARRYEIPAFRKDMRHSASNEVYLRPTRYCNPREPEIIAMANALGAYELSDREFAEAAFWFVKDNIAFEMLPLDSAVNTLKRGTGTCIHYITLFNALCRAAGIKARYKFFAMSYERYSTSSRHGGGIIDPLWDGMYDSLGYVMAEAESEVYIDGVWMVSYPVTPAEVQASAGLPIIKLGEEPIGVFFDVIPRTTRRVESVPIGIDWGVKILLRISPASGERVAVHYQRRDKRGRQVIAEAGGREAYNRMARERLQRSSPTIEIQDNAALVFVE